MISNFIKLTLVSLMLTVGFLPQLSFGQPPELPNPTPEQITAYIELVQDYIRQTKPEFEEVFKLKLSELGESYDSHGYRSYLHSLKMIEQQMELPTNSELLDSRFVDPKLEDGYNATVHSTFSYGAGDVAVAWDNGKPIVISSKPETLERTMYVQEGMDLMSDDVRRLIYDLHVYGGDNGFGLSDLVKINLKDSVIKRSLKLMNRFRKKHFVRGVDLKIVTVNSKGIILDTKISKKPRYLSAQYFKEWFGAMNLGRGVTRSKIIRAGLFGGVATASSLVFTNMEMATVMLGLTVSSQLYYEGYLTFKYKNSRLMQIIKTTALIAFTGTLFTVLKYGFDDIEAWSRMIGNTFKASAIFITAAYAKQMLLDSGMTKRGLRYKYLSRLLGRKLKMKAAKHDFILDNIVSLMRQMDLVTSNPLIMPIVFAGLHIYAGVRYLQIVKQKLLNSSVRLISKEIFFIGYIKQAITGLKNGCSSLFGSKRLN